MKRARQLLLVATFILMIAVYLVATKRDTSDLERSGSKLAQQNELDRQLSEGGVRSASRDITRNVRNVEVPSFGIIHAKVLLESGVTRNQFLIWTKSKPAISSNGYEQYQLEDGKVSLTLSIKDYNSIESWHIVNNRAEQVAASDR